MTLNFLLRQFRLPVVMLATLTLAIGGCTHLFFFPTQPDFPFLIDDKVAHERLQLVSKDGTRLAAMRLTTVNQPKGVALQFHGNAQNMTSHYRFLNWLPAENWEVLTFDYRGYGQSEGTLGSFSGELDGVVEDGVAAIKWANQRAKELGVPLVIFGQSLGGNLSLRSLVEIKPSHLRLIVIDSSFYSFKFHNS